MPLIKIEVNGQIKTGPSENWPTVKKSYPNAKIIGLAEPEQVLPGKSIRTAIEAGRKFAGQLPQARLLGAIASGAKAIQSKVEEIPGALAQRGVSPRIAAGIGLAPAVASELLPQSPGEVAAQVALGPFGKAVSRPIAAEARRVVPGLLTALSGIPEKATEALISKPGQVSTLAQLGEQGAMGKAVEFVKTARAKLAGLVSQANVEQRALQGQILEATKGSKIIPIDNILIESAKDAAEKGLIEGLPSTDRVGLSILKRFVESFKQLGKSGKMAFDDSNTMRVQLNAALGNPKLSPQAKSVLQTMKSELDTSIGEGIGEDLAGQYRAILEKQSKVRGLRQELEPIFESKNAPIRIAKSVETGDELSQVLDEFDNAAGGGLLENVKLAVRSIPFGAQAQRGLGVGSSLAMATKSPLGLASRIPFLGRLISPQAIARQAEVISRFPFSRAARVAIPASRSLFGGP